MINYSENQKENNEAKHFNDFNGVPCGYDLVLSAVFIMKYTRDV